MNATHSEHTLHVDGLCVSYGRVPALREIAFSARCGQRVALIGPNGAGKSTLLKAMIGLVPSDHGTVVWRGKPLLKGTPEVAYVPQRSNVDWKFPATVRRIVEMGRYPLLGWWRPFRKSDAEAVDRALAALDLEALQDRQISALSGGQQQRVFLARALAQEAHVLLLDEPLAGLDADGQESLIRLLGDLAAGGRLVIASHHDLDSAPDAFDLALVLNRRPFAFAPVAEALAPGIVASAFGRVPPVP